MQKRFWTLSLLQAGSRCRGSLTQMQSKIFFWTDDLQGRTRSPEDRGQSHGEQLLEIRTELKLRDWPPTLAGFQNCCGSLTVLC